MARKMEHERLVDAWIRVMHKEDSDEHDPDFWLSARARVLKC